jgi:gliding motility-associated-like protein
MNKYFNNPPFVKTLLFVFGILFGFKGFSQLTVTPSTNLTDVNNYVQTVLAGPGVVITNVAFTGNFDQVGTFNGTSSDIGFTGGMIINAGDINELEPPTSSASGSGGFAGSALSNADLLSVAQSVASNPAASSITITEDLAILEFDFVPSSTVVNFNFVFASDEYLTFINTQYNDVFGFFVSGPGITGPYASPVGFPGGSANLAVVPGTTTPITISTIHPGLNSSYYIDNPSETTHPFNGHTTAIPINFNVICGETYHFKFAVADCGDDFLTTAVFLQEGSFSSPPVDLSLITSSGTNTIAEACLDADVLFIRSACESLDSLEVNFTVGGTATLGVDYTLAASPIWLVPGQDTASINIAPIIDALAEGVESITISVSYIDNSGNTQTITGEVFIEDIEPLVVTPNDVSIQCFNDSIPITFSVSGGSGGGYTYDWLASSETTNFDTVSIQTNGTYYYKFTVVDPCLGPVTDSVRVIMNQTISIDSMLSYAASSCLTDGVVSGFASGIVGVPSYNWIGPGTTGTYTVDASVMLNIPTGWYYFSVEDNVCNANDSVFVDVTDPVIAAAVPSIVQGCDPLEVLFDNTSQNQQTVSFDWGDGTSSNVSGSNDASHVFTQSSIVSVIAYDNSCTDTTFITITVANCGCTDPNALNYDITANLDNGSCQYPLPLIEAPNVITPNGDLQNDVFELKLENVVEVNLIITNRWGNVVFEKTDPNPKWEGKDNGTLCTEGVYFYQYIAKGVNGAEVDGHGFVQLIRK